MINWEEKLKGLFADPLLDEVRPLQEKITPDNRLVESFMEIVSWVDTNKRMPCNESDDFEERKLYRRLDSIRGNSEKLSYLREFDTLHLLD